MATEPIADTPKVGYEWRDANTRGLFVFFVCMGGALLLTGFLLVWLFGYLARTTQPAPVIDQPFGNARPMPEAPLLQAQPNLDIQEYMKSQQQILQSFGWMDRKRGVVRIPIDDALKLLARRGLPARPPQSSTALKQSRGANTGSSRDSHQEATR